MQKKINSSRQYISSLMSLDLDRVCCSTNSTITHEWIKSLKKPEAEILYIFFPQQ